MNEDDLKTYLIKNSRVADLFMEKCLPYLQAQNEEKAPARRLNDTMLQREADKLFDEFIGNIYGRMTSQLPGSATEDQWISYMDNNDMLEGLEDSMSELNFGSEED